MCRLSFVFVMIFIAASTSQEVLKCDFEGATKGSTDLPCTCDGNNCPLEQIQTDQIDWIAWQGGTDTKTTGPEVDHTDKNSNGFYIYFEISYLPPNTEAIIKTPTLHMDQISCLQFWYHMYGQHIGSLKVRATLNNGTTSSPWQQSGNEGDEWRVALMLLLPNVEYVLFVASKEKYGSYHPHGDIALDDITIKRGLCEGFSFPPGHKTTSTITFTTSTTTTTTTTTTTETPRRSVSHTTASNRTHAHEIPKHESTTDPSTIDTPAGNANNNSNGDKTTIIIAVVVVAVVLIAVSIIAALLILKYRKKKNPDDTENHSATHAQPALPAHISGASPKVPHKKPPITKKPNLTVPTKNPGLEYINNNEFEAILHRANPGPSPSSSPSPESDPPSPCPTPASSLPEDQEPGSIYVANLEKYVAKKRTNLDQFTKEYKSLPQADMARCVIAQTDDNKDKNRFKNIFPYDDTRPILSIDEDTEFNFGEYINASYLPGYDREEEYIATQGPRPATVVDFWRLVWQENVNRIVMVANLVDDGKKRVEQYWPESGEYLESGDFVISCDGAVVCADYTTRILTVQKGNDSRIISQFHFTSWEDKNKPLFGAMTLFAFHRKVRSFSSQSTGPMLVHCSAGVGRTGTFIVFDILLKQAEQEGLLDIYGWIKKLRHYRMFIVQTKEQYFFLHDALVEYLKSGPTSHESYNFGATFQRLKELDPNNGNISEIQRQYNVLSTFKTQRVNHTRDGEKGLNKQKNRDMEILPDDNQRPYLSTPYKEGNNYINAVFVSGFKKHEQYIVTQMPLENTVVDLWRLVWDHSCHTIVMLNSTDRDKQPYWPKKEGQKLVYGPIEIELLKINPENARAFVNVRDIKVKLTNKRKSPGYDTEEHSIMVRHFQLLSWPDSEEIPSKPGDLLDLQEMVHSWQQQRILDSDEKSRVIVHCSDGASKSGLYCAVSHTLDRMKVEQEVDAFLAVRYVARNRPQFIKSLNQYTFLYQMALECMTRYNEYANFQ